MADPQPGSAVAKELGLALAQIYNHVKAGRVKNHKVGGYPEGKGIEVDPDEVRAAIASMGSRKRATGGKSTGATPSGRGRKVTHEDTVTMHKELDADEAERRRRRRASGDEGNTVRLHRYVRGESIPCPVNPGHGPVYLMEQEGKGKARTPKYHCSHQEHDGRTRNHPSGFAPATQNIFTPEEVGIAQPSGTLGVVMLSWIHAGQTSLANDLETWMEKHSVQVWIPAR